MRTPALLSMSSKNNQNRQLPNIISRSLKRKSTDIDILQQTQIKTSRKCNNIYNNYNQQPFISSSNNNNNYNNIPESQTVEYVNIMFDNNLMPLQNAILSEADSVNINDFSATWNNSDLLDLDQKGSYRNESMIECDDNGSCSQSEDLEDKNLSWLFNFKLDELPHLSPEVNRTRYSNVNTNINHIKNDIVMNDPCSVETDNLNVAENIVIENTVKAPKKPPFTYTELIEYALEDRGELTVSGIYQWISDRFPFYKSNDDRWKNSVRHNLSINPHFRKGSKAPQGAGHLWTISTRESETNLLAWEHKKQRLELFFKMEAANSKILKETTETVGFDETVAATASISFGNQSDEISDSQQEPEIIHQSYTLHPQICHMDNNDELRRAAGEILNGVRRNVEVQILNQSPSNNFQAFALLESGDYLNPVPKDQIVQECGLRSIGRNEIGNEFYVTEIDPIELGINMSTNGDDELFGDDFNLTYFGLGNNIMA